MPAVPLHALTAPKMASGKTLLATLAGYVATGRAAAMMSQADDPNEERKRLLAVLLEGQNIVIVDNVERELKSDALCTVLTEPMFSDRLLGFSRTVSAPSSATFFATGNNLTIAGDLTARVVLCTLDPACEKPGERTFEVNLHEEVPRRRAELATAALTIVRGYLAAGEPNQAIPNFARFEDWSRFVRAPLVWLGMADPCANGERIEDRDPVREALAALLLAWRSVFYGQAVPVQEAIAEATEPPRFGESPESVADRRALFGALSAIGSRRGDLEPRLIGNFLSKHERRFEGGLRFLRAGTTSGAVRWGVSDA